MKHLTYEELEAWRRAGVAFQLIDVREISEHEDFNIGGENIPMSELFSAMSRLASDKPVVFYCKRGIRSQIAIQKLKRHFPEADFYNLREGILNLAKK